MANCPIIEQTGDGKPVGQCHFYLEEGVKCSRHGDVEPELTLYNNTRKLTLENDLRKRRGEVPLGENKKYISDSEFKEKTIKKLKSLEDKIDNKIVIEDEDNRPISIVRMIIVTFLFIFLMFLFYGEPDVFDSLRSNIMSSLGS